MASSPNNYYIGKGIAYFKQATDLDWVDLGNAPEIEFTPELTKLEHFSSREGVRTKDKTVVIEKKATLRIVLEEWTRENLMLALLGSLTTDSDANDVISIFSENAISGQFKFVGTNEVGEKWEWILLSVELIPAGGVGLISDEWGQLELTGDVAAVDGEFGTVRNITASA